VARRAPPATSAGEHPRTSAARRGSSSSEPSRSADGGSTLAPTPGSCSASGSSNGTGVPRCRTDAGVRRGSRQALARDDEQASRVTPASLLQFAQSGTHQSGQLGAWFSSGARVRRRGSATLACVHRRKSAVRVREDAPPQRPSCIESGSPHGYARRAVVAEWPAGNRQLRRRLKTRKDSRASTQASLCVRRFRTLGASRTLRQLCGVTCIRAGPAANNHGLRAAESEHFARTRCGNAPSGAPRG
jgi:hypothetical protein